MSGSKGQESEIAELVANMLEPFKKGDWIRFKWFSGTGEGVVTGDKRGMVKVHSADLGDVVIEVQNIVAHVSKEFRADDAAIRAAKVEGLELVKAHVERRIKFIEQLLGGTDPHTQRHVAHAEVIEYCEASIAELEREGEQHGA